MSHLQNCSSALNYRLKPACLRFEAAVERELRTEAGWQTAKDGNPEKDNPDNVRTYLRIAKVEFRRNLWTNKDEVKQDEKDWRPLADHDLDSFMTDAANTQYRFRPSEAMFKRTVRAVAREVEVDPVLNRIAECEAKWDRASRLDTWLHHACGTPDDPYHQAVARNVLGGLVKRARKPGCKHDEVMVLIGDEDKFKSTLARRVALSDEWFNDSVNCEGGDQNVIPQLFGRTVIELAELNMTKREVTFWKNFISRQSDDITLKYKALSEKFPRRNIFIATSNNDQPLLSDTGNRRFLPVKLLREIDLAWIDANLDQLIGEAAVLQTAGELFLIPREVIPEARAIQEDARDVSGTEVFVREWFEDRPDDTYVTSGDLERALIASKTGRIQGAVREALRKIGFVKFQQRMSGQKIRGFVKSKHLRTSEWRRLIYMCLPNSTHINFTLEPPPGVDAAGLPANVYAIHRAN
jgi:predicted P-loop ATPase